MNLRARELILQLQLEPHPEGGFFRETWRSAITVRSPRNGELRPALTDIYFLLISGQPSHFHKVEHDELWHFHEGSPLVIVEMDPRTYALTEHRLGQDNKQTCYQHCVPAGVWQAAFTEGPFSLVSCAVAPGFDFSDFTLLRDNAPLAKLTTDTHPHLAGLI